ncbi:MAG: putative Ig domain-containing protein [Fidelibacterota bacterium]
MTRSGRFLVIISLLGLLQADDLQILHMTGTYDLDQDGQLEFLALEAKQGERGQPSFLRYYELDKDGYQDLIWEVASPDGLLGHFVDAMLGDMDGNGEPELITIMNVSGEHDRDLLQPIVFIYPVGEVGFQEEPAASLRLASKQPFIRCQNFQLLDVDGDGDQEIAASLGAPLRSVVLIDRHAEGDLYERTMIDPAIFRTGAGFVFVAALDYDRDFRDDIILFSPEGNVLKAQTFYNNEETFEPGPLVTKTIPGLDQLLPRKIVESDWDNDGFKDMLLPFKSGHLLALTPTPETTVIDQLSYDGGPLSDLNVGDFNQDKLDDLLLVSGAMNLMTLVASADTATGARIDYFSLEDESNKTQVFATLPLTQMGLYLGTVIGAGWDGETSAVFMTELGRGPEEIAPPLPLAGDIPREQVDLLAEFPEMPDTQFSLPEVPRPARTTGQALPPGVLPRHVLPVNQAFAYTIPEEEGENFYSFRWLQPPPKGMYFHYDTKSILWTPDETQLGAFQLAYHVEMQVGETVVTEPTENDSLMSYSVKPELEGYDEYLWVYVNDPPVFLSQPEGTEFVVNSVFEYEPVVRDRNIDDVLQLDLEVAPEGMVLDSGRIIWTTDSSHVDVYDVRLVVTDGFDRTAQEFKLFARAGVRIISKPPLSGAVNQPYRYETEVWHQNLDQPVTVLLYQPPDGMEISTDGIIEWTPDETQIDTQTVAIVARQGVATDTQFVAIFVNHPPVLDAIPPPMTMINLGNTWDFQIEAHDPNEFDELTFTAITMPEGMRMDPYSGRLRWDPTGNQLDFSQLKMEISDGHTIRSFEAEFFVNAPIKIVSIPQLQATVGEEYKHEIMTSDRNRATLLPFRKTVKVMDAANARLYAVNISDDVYRENIERYIGDWNHAETVYLTDPTLPEDDQISRLNLKKYVHSIFYEDDRLYVIVMTIDERTVKIKDVLWEFFHGNQGTPPKVVVEKRSMLRYSLVDFPDGMIIDELTGTIHWTPTKDQVNKQKVTLVVSDGYAKDEQTFEIYVNHPPTIVSRPPAIAQVDEVYRYQIQVEDANEDAYLEYELVKGPQGMQLSRDGKLVWVPQASQINTHLFEVKVSDGYREDVQQQKVFVNIAPTVLSKPKPVALTGYEYRYKLTAEDLNKDEITLRPIRLPKYAKFNPRTGGLTWKPRNNQLGPNEVVILVIDEHGATTTHSFQIHVFEDPSARQFVNTSWPLMLTFVGVMFAWGISQM